MGQIRWLCFSLILIVTACKKQNDDGYSRDSKGYSYKLLAIGDGKLKPAANGALICTMILKTTADSVFFNSTYNAPGGFSIYLPEKNPSSGKSYLRGLVEGDSISLKIPKDCFFREYFDTLAPVFYGGDSLVKMDLKIQRLLSPEEYAASNPGAGAAQEDRELQELKLIDNYLDQYYPTVEADANGLYILEHQSTSSEKVSYGKRIRVNYSGFYLNGTPLDNGSQQLEFTFGTPDQLVKGLNIVIGNLKKGETTKIIVPSRLAFGESGSTNGSIPPYTPLLYNIKLIDIK